MRANPAGASPATGVPSPSTTKNNKKPVTWPDATVSRVAFRFHALGGSERAARLLLSHLAATGVRRLDAYVNGISDQDLRAYLAAADQAAEQAEHAAGMRRRRGDLLTVRTPARWPWPTTSSGGGRGV